MIQLYSGPVSMFGAKAEIAVLEKGIACERIFVPFSLATLYDPKHPVVARVNPKGQVPVLVDGISRSSTPPRSSSTSRTSSRGPCCAGRPARARSGTPTRAPLRRGVFPNVVTLMPRARVAAGEDGVRAAHAAIDRSTPNGRPARGRGVPCRDVLVRRHRLLHAQFFASFSADRSPPPYRA